MGVLDFTATWPVPTVAAAIVDGDRVVERTGPTNQQFRVASLAKPVSAWAMLVAVEEGVITLDTPIGQPGCTLRHLLAHAGGYPFNGHEPIAPIERTRTYSNGGIELAADAVAAAAEMPFAQYLHDAVLWPLGMTESELVGSPAHGLRTSVDDLVAFLRETRAPSLITPDTAADAIRTQYPGLSGIVPGVGRFERCPWGLGFEIRGDKQPHWTGLANAPTTYGHFGGAGTMMWRDPAADVAVVALTDRPFDEWGSTALQRWPELSDAALATYGSAGGRST